MMKVGLIGCGGIAPLHVRVYKRMRDVELVAVCDLNLQKAKALAAKFDVKNVFEDYQRMLDAAKLDMVDVCTPVTTHKRIVCDLARTVPAILVEKPMALNVEECDEMIREVKKYRSKLCIGHNQIFSPNIQRAKLMVDSGEFRLFSFRTSQKESYELLHAQNLAPAWNVLPEQRGIIWEVCCHLAYLQLHFLPAVREVYAVGSKVKYPVYDNFCVLLRTEDERFGIIELSWLSHETDIVYELEDLTGRRLEIYRDFDYLLEKSEEPPFSVKLIGRNFLIDEKRVFQKWTRFGICYFRKRKLLPTFNLINSYINAIKKDLPPPVTPEDGRKTISLLECIEKSLDEKRPALLG
jgi:predicted dehydrogenase